jgi:ATP-dependent DNA ligase
MEAVTVVMHEERRDETCRRVQVLVFDRLALDGADLRGRPLRERKALLGRVLGAGDASGPVAREHLPLRSVLSAGGLSPM